jgi:hypothetical protein
VVFFTWLLIGPLIAGCSLFVDRDCRSRAAGFCPEGSRCEGSVCVSSDGGVPDSDLNPGHLTFTVDQGETRRVFRVEAREAAIAEDVSLGLDHLDPRVEGDDESLNLSPDGQWLILTTTHFDADCEGWPCLAVVSADLSEGDVVQVEGLGLLRPAGWSAIASGGDLVVCPIRNDDDRWDLWAYSRAGPRWSPGVLLTERSPHQFNDQPAFSDEGDRVVFKCGDTIDGLPDDEHGGAAICEVAIDSTGFREVLTPVDGPSGTSANTLSHPDYGPDGSIVFEADWEGGTQVWRLPQGVTTPGRVNIRYDNDNTPCVLPDGRIASVWLYPPLLKVMVADGSEHIIIRLDDVEVTGYGLGCGE